MCDKQNINGTWNDDILKTSYILGGLSTYPVEPPLNVLNTLSKGFRELFDLLEKPQGLPVKLKNEFEKSGFSQVFALSCIRAVLSAVRFIKRFSYFSPGNEISASILHTYSTLYHSYLALSKKYEESTTKQNINSKEKANHISDRQNLSGSESINIDAAATIKNGLDKIKREQDDIHKRVKVIQNKLKSNLPLVFISYAREDLEKARLIHENL